MWDTLLDITFGEVVIGTVLGLSLVGILIYYDVI